MTTRPHRTDLVRMLVRLGAPLLLAAWLAPAHGAWPTRVGIDGDPIETSLELRADIYSSSAVELFWRRIDVPGVRYEVRRDGAPPIDTDGASLYVDGLAGGREHRFEVVAVAAGERVSDTESVAVTTPVEAGVVRDTPDADGAGAGLPPPERSADDRSAGPAAPTSRFDGIVPFDPVVEADLDGSVAEPLELRVAVYSASAIELFWNRLPGDDVRYDVIVGPYFVTSTNTSQFADGLDLASAGVAGVIAYDSADRVLGAQFTYVPF